MSTPLLALTGRPSREKSRQSYSLSPCSRLAERNGSIDPRFRRFDRRIRDRGALVALEGEADGSLEGERSLLRRH